VPGDHLKKCFLELNKFEFWAYQEAENNFEVQFYHLNRSFIDMKNVALSVGEDRKSLQSAFDNLIHRFFDFIQIAFWGGHEAEICSQVLANTRKFALLNSPKSYFWAVPKAENRLKVPCGPLK